MDERNLLADRFEQNRAHLGAVAYRMLGSVSEAEDAVQEAWFRLSRTNATEVENLRAWLTTVVAHVCLDMLRARKAKHEESLETQPAEPTGELRSKSDPEREAELAESVGLAVLVVLETLAPAERLAFVLHDMFAVPFEEIAPIVGRSPDAARQLASRARRRVQGAPPINEADLREQREVVDAFLTALRAGDFEGLLAVLDPDVVARVDPAVAAPGAPTEVRGAQNWAKGAVAFSRLARFVEPMLVNGGVGLVFAPRGRLLRALSFTIRDGKIVAVEVIGDPERLRQLDLAILND